MISAGKNIALGGVAYQKYTSENQADAGNSIDADRMTDLANGSCSNVENTTDPWWALDTLMQDVPIVLVRIQVPTDIAGIVSCFTILYRHYNFNS